jgi:hypothetical protein
VDGAQAAALHAWLGAAHAAGYMTASLGDFRADANPQVKITDEVRRQQAGLHGAV